MSSQDLENNMGSQGDKMLDGPQFTVYVATLNTKMIAKSGIGMAIRHQKQALDLQGIEYLKKPGDNYDILHANTYDFGTLYWVKRSKRKGKKVIIHAHSTEEDFRNSFTGTNLVSPFFKGWIKFFYNLGDLVITPTPYSKELLEGYGLKKPIIHCSNGVNLKKFHSVEPAKKAAIREKLGVGPDEKIVLSVGLPIMRKGIFDFVEIAEQMPEYKFIWCGGVSKAALPLDTINLLNRAKKVPNIMMPGYVEDMVSAYQAADVFFMPSLEETEGIVMLEALASKTPILARNIGAYRPWLQGDKHVIFGEDNEEFKTKLRAMMDGAYDLDALTSEGYKIAEERSMENISKKLKGIYEDLLAGKFDGKPYEGRR